MFSTIIISLIIYIAVIGLGYLWWRIWQNSKKIEKVDNKEYSLLEILVPRNNAQGPLGAESMFASMHGVFNHAVLEQEKLSFEIASKGNFIIFYVYAPTYLKDFIEGQIYAQYPTVEITQVNDYTQRILNEPSKMAIAGTEIILSKDDVFPIKTFLNFEVDPLASITGMLAKIEEGQQLWIQIIVRPISDEWHKRGIRYVQTMKETGKAPEAVQFTKEIKGKIVDFSKDVAKSASTILQTAPSEGGDKGSGGGPEVKLPGPMESALTGVEQKITKLGFNVTIRVLAIAEDMEAAQMKIAGLVGTFKQFNTINLNSFVAKEIKQGNEILEDFIERKTSVKPYILNIEELASIFHLPNVSVETPLIGWAGSKKGEPPANLPVRTNLENEDITTIGETNFRHYRLKFGVKQRDRRLHIYSIGKTGTGKSTLLENMIIDDIIKGRGVAVVDPHGDLINHLLSCIPDERIDDVVYFSPADRDYPIGFNILESVDPDLKNIVASGVVGIFKKIFGDSWGPRLEYILRNAVLSLLEYPDSTMLGVTKILIDKNYRKKIVSHIADPVIKDFWINEFDKYDQKFRTEAVAPIQNKVGQFLATSTIRNIVGQPQSTINLNEIMDNKKILLIDLSIGKIGEDIAALLGAMMITKIQLAAMQRASIPEEERVDFYLYVDEFQNFATESFATILSEARKYHLNLTMTNQYIAQMPEEVREAVFGNVGTIISFRTGAGDSAALVKEFEPVFDANDLVNLDNYNIYVKMAIDGVTSPAFSAKSLPPRTESFDNKEEIIESSRRKYAKNREEVENKINELSDMNEPEAGEKPNSQEDGKIDKHHFQTQEGIYFNDNKGRKWYVVENSKIKEQKAKIDKENNKDIIDDRLAVEDKDIQPIEEL